LTGIVCTLVAQSSPFCGFQSQRISYLRSMVFAFEPKELSESRKLA